MSFFQNLNFSSSNEDGNTELAALRGAQRILCLTGSGTRPLDMLVSSASEVIALDTNPLQNALLALKVAAMATMEREDYLAFLGITPAADRLRTYDHLRSDLASEIRAIWDAKRRMIKNGIWYAGLWERVLRFGSIGIRLIRGRSIDLLFEAKDPTVQARIWRDRFDDRIWRSSIRLLGRRWFWSKVIGEPGGDFLPSPQMVEERLAGSFNRASSTFLLRESDFAWLILRGKHSPEAALPLHMTAANYASVKSSLSKLRIANGGITDLGTMTINSIDGFSLSDFGSYCTMDAYSACWQAIVEAAMPDARFCERVFMNPLQIPFANVQVDPDLSARLSAADKAIIYDIRAGTIAG